ncbi:complement resistance protein TraT [Catenovulum sp. SM1970]|uniref:complement resistance protein TraT n=1 Tax=Marinifaba aquimaris TaxID=2741323 RepID=UPI00157254FB|nr:complement resistance protein TraT [Marinifaba aquimaris]NTS77457.1 complement resistance protein TraT [Marinifaba aquimaris]
MKDIRFRFSCLLAILILLAGCSALGTATKKQDLAINTKLTQTIFLDPVAPDKRTVFLQLKNSSESAQFNIEPTLTNVLASAGYQVTDNPELATYWLQANVRYVGPPEGKEFEDVMSSGSAAVQGAIAGAAISAATGGDGSDNAKAALLVALIGYAADSMVDDVYHTAITDVQLSEKTNDIVTDESKHHLSQGESGTTKQTITSTTNRKKYQTRVLITANQMNMVIAEAEVKMQEKLTQALSGLF